MTKVLAISDTHFPFHSKKALKKVLELVKKERPTHVVQIGDLLDQYALSRYARTLNLATPADELRKGVEAAKVMWEKIRKTVPRAKLYQLRGNHDERAVKRLMDKLPEFESIVNIDGMYSFPNVCTMETDRDFVIIDEVVYVHGWLSKSLDHAKHFNKPVVHGHRHRAVIETEGKLWSMDVGFLGDESQEPFRYTMSKVTKWTLAVGIVENRKPRLILL